MTYNVFGGTFSLTQSINQSYIIYSNCSWCCVCQRGTRVRVGAATWWCTSATHICWVVATRCRPIARNTRSTFASNWLQTSCQRFALFHAFEIKITYVLIYEHWSNSMLIVLDFLAIFYFFSIPNNTVIWIYFPFCVNLTFIILISSVFFLFKWPARDRQVLHAACRWKSLTTLLFWNYFLLSRE